MNAISPFLFEDEHLVRVVMRDDEPWFVAKDVCKVLDIVWKGSDSTGPLGSLDEDERGIVSADTPGGHQKMVIISESGLYAFVFRSRKPQAKRFRKWVTSEVLPSIRKTGRYEAPQAPQAAPAYDAAPLAENTPSTDMRLWLDGISLALRVHGLNAARRLWATSPLPQVGGAVPDLSGVPGTVNDAEGCLRHLLDMVLGRSGLTVAEALAQLQAGTDEAEGISRLLRDNGLILGPRGFAGWLAVSNTLSPLKRHFTGTPWADLWAPSLVSLPGAMRAAHALHFGTTCTRAVLIPPELVRQDGAEAFTVSPA